MSAWFPRDDGAGVATDSGAGAGLGAAADGNAGAGYGVAVDRSAAAIASGAAHTGTVLNIQRMSTEDGPGLRTTVFLKGCSLACAWCHNPESMCRTTQLVRYDAKCVHAKACVPSCPEHALSFEGNTVTIDRDRCTRCGDCVESCPGGAFEMLGREWDAEALADELAKDRAYFERSGGGVTVSGGEPGLQAPFVVALLEACRRRGLRTAVDTAGLVARDALLSLARAADVVLFDLKHIDADEHRRLTGQPNERILDNARALADFARREGKPEVWIRTPLVPGATATEANVVGIGAWIAAEMGDVVGRWELCAFNNLAADKYARLGLVWSYEGSDAMTRNELAALERLARSCGVDPERVLATGPVRVECEA